MALIKTFNVNVDIELSASSNPVFSISQGDLNTIQLLFALTQDGQPLDLTNRTLRMAIRKPSGMIVYQDCTIDPATPTDGNASVMLSTEGYTEVGQHTAELYVYEDGQTKVAVTATFTYNSRMALLNDGTLESNNDFQAINDAMAGYDKKPLQVQGVPTAVPEYVGQMAYDTINNESYIANGTSWQKIGSGSAQPPKTGAGNPNGVATPAYVGELYVDTDTKEAYIAGGLTVNDWQSISMDELGASGGVVVEDILTSTSTVNALSANQGRVLNGKFADKADKLHTHYIADIQNLQSTLEGKADDVHSHVMTDVAGLLDELAGKASTTHNHAIADVTDLQTTLDGKASTEHTHDIADVTNLQSYLDAKYDKEETYSKTEIDSLDVGGANIVKNSAFKDGLTNWILQSGTNEVVSITDLGRFNKSFHGLATTPLYCGISQTMLGDKPNYYLGKKLRVSFYAKWQNVVAGANSWERLQMGLYYQIKKADGTTQWIYPQYPVSAVGTAMTWTRYDLEVVLDGTGLATEILDIRFKANLEACTGEFWITGIKIEEGDFITQWNAHPKDGVETVNDKVIKFWSGTQAEYDAITTKDVNTMYFITG
jgi:hypothetical protein